MNTKKKNIVYNILFLVVCGVIFTFLYIAPPETTSPLPNDEDHQRFMQMEKKAAEKLCEQCHSNEGVSPLPDDHPPKYRCLFCHKRTKQ